MWDGGSLGYFVDGTVSVERVADHHVEATLDLTADSQDSPLEDGIIEGRVRFERCTIP